MRSVTHISFLVPVCSFLTQTGGGTNCFGRERGLFLCLQGDLRTNHLIFFNLDIRLQVIKAQEAGAVGVIVADRVGFCLCLELVQTQTNQSGHIKFNFNNFFTSF